MKRFAKSSADNKMKRGAKSSAGDKTKRGGKSSPSDEMTPFAKSSAGNKMERVAKSSADVDMKRFTESNAGDKMERFAKDSAGDKMKPFAESSAGDGGVKNMPNDDFVCEHKEYHCELAAQHSKAIKDGGNGAKKEIIASGVRISDTLKDSIEQSATLLKPQRNGFMRGGLGRSTERAAELLVRASLEEFVSCHKLGDEREKDECNGQCDAQNKAIDDGANSAMEWISRVAAASDPLKVNVADA